MGTLGEKIRAARTKKGMRGEELGLAVELTKGTISKFENDDFQPNPRTLIRIADALDAPEILIHHCDTCPIRQHIMLRQYPELNNIKPDPAIIASRLVRELGEAKAAAEDLAEFMTNKDFKSREGYQEIFEQKMEQILDAERNIEILKFQLLLSGTHTKQDLDRVAANQQAKCEANGHHIPAKTGTEG